MAASWCKVSTDLDSHPKIRQAGRNGREVFCFAIRRNSAPGIAVPGMIPASYLAPWYLADQLMMSEADAIDGVRRAVAAGLLDQIGDKAFRIVGWDDEWGRIPKSSAERQAEFRARQRGDLPALEKKTYAIEQVGSGFVKIGRAANIAQRLYDLQVASPLPLRLVGFSLSDIEGPLHEQLKPHRANGEWFNLNPNVINVLSDVMTMTNASPDVTSNEISNRSNGAVVTRDDNSNGLKRDKTRSEEKREDQTRGEVVPPSADKRKKPAVSLPVTWAPGPEHAELAAKRGVDLELQFAKFRAHAEANDRRAVRWGAAFTNWLLNAWPDRKLGSANDGMADLLRMANGESL